MNELKDKVALVTGATSGIGKAAALLMSRAGARIGVLGRNDEALQEVAEKIEAEGGKALILDADISRPEECRRAAETLTENWQRIDVVFANAGINGVWAPIDQLKPEDWKKTLDVNLSGTFYTIQACYDALRKRGGSVIICSSVNGTRMFSNSGATAYACSKAGQLTMGKMLALELARDRIRVNVICPGKIETPIHEKTEHRESEEAREPVKFPEGEIPLTDGEPGTAEQVAELVLFLASDRSSHITGTPVWIDGGQSLLQG